MGRARLFVKTILLACCLATISAKAQSQDFEIAKKIIASGNNNGALACVACHQENGAGIATAGFPQLAGMNAAYFSKQIYDYQNLQRVNPIMQPIAKGLSEAEIKNLAAYFALLPPVANANVQLSATNFELGKAIAKKGMWDKGMPACFACHGPSGRGVGESFPGITNQGKTYLVQQLQAWKTGTRKNDPNQLMATVAKKLTQKEMDSVAEYLSSGSVHSEETK
jgi:cytochrome c553